MGASSALHDSGSRWHQQVRMPPSTTMTQSVGSRLARCNQQATVHLSMPLAWPPSASMGHASQILMLSTQVQLTCPLIVVRNASLSSCTRYAPRQIARSRARQPLG
eukprot:scaffold91973_cov41-Tisochrysis_lutea.AAC.3